MKFDTVIKAGKSNNQIESNDMFPEFRKENCIGFAQNQEYECHRIKYALEVSRWHFWMNPFFQRTINESAYKESNNINT
jgi:hypothetical protein